MKRFVLFSFCAALLTGRLVAQPADVALLAASDALLQPIRAQLTGVTHEAHGAWELTTGQFGSKTVVLVRTEGDPTNAVAATTLALQLHRPRLVIVFGVSRSFDPGLKAGDVVVSSGFAAFDGMFSPARGLGEGTTPLAWEAEPHLLMTAGENETPTAMFPIDQAAEQTALRLSPAHGRSIAAVLGSARQTNREADRIAWLREQWHVSTEDGDSAYVAGACALFGVPVVGFRVINGTEADVADFTLRFMEGQR